MHGSENTGPRGAEWEVSVTSVVTMEVPYSDLPLGEAAVNNNMD